ncbi:MAG: hypothetical protein V4501_08230 [Pseudomonadota bacterium]
MITNKLMVAVTAVIFGASGFSFVLAKHKANSQMSDAGQYRPFSSAEADQEPQAGDVIVPPLIIKDEYRSKSRREQYEDQVQSRYRRPVLDKGQYRPSPSDQRKGYREQRAQYLAERGAAPTYDYTQDEQPRRRANRYDD